MNMNALLPENFASTLGALTFFLPRICPGRHFAESMLSLSIASALHVFEISAPLDGDGNPIRIRPSMTEGGVWSVPSSQPPDSEEADTDVTTRSYLEDCRCVVKPRSPETAVLIERELAGMR